MKFLKKFNESTNEWYQEISTDEYDRRIQTKIPIPESHVTEITKYLDKFWNIKFKFSTSIKSRYLTIFNFSDQFQIFFTEDLYYLIIDMECFYKCDDIDGLMVFIKEMVVK